MMEVVQQRKESILYVLRKKRGWKQREVAEKLDISRHMYSLIENAHHKPGIQLGLKISKLYKIHPYKLYDQLYAS